MFLPTCHPQLFCNQLPFYKVDTLNSRDWFSLHTYTSRKLCAAGRKDKVKLSSLIILVKLVITQCNRYVKKQQIQATSTHCIIEFMHWQLIFLLCITFSPSFTPLNFPLGFKMHCYPRQINADKTVWYQTSVLQQQFIIVSYLAPFQYDGKNNWIPLPEDFVCLHLAFHHRTSNYFTEDHFWEGEMTKRC